MLKEISQKIIDLFKASASLREPDKVKKWYLGPPAAPVAHPYGYVKVRGGPLATLTVSSEQFEAEWDCVVIDKQPAEDTAEKNVMDLTEAMRSVLDANPTLGALVDYSAVVTWDFDVLPTEFGPLYGGRVVLRIRKVL